MKPTIRVLDPEEHSKLVGLGPFTEFGPDPATSIVVVAENDHGGIIGYWCTFNAVHLEPLWVAEAERGDGIGMALWDGVRKVLADNGVSSAFAMVGDEDVMTHLPLAGKLGFHRVPVSTLFIKFDTGEEGH